MQIDFGNLPLWAIISLILVALVLIIRKCDTFEWFGWKAKKVKDTTDGTKEVISNSGNNNGTIAREIHVGNTNIKAEKVSIKFQAEEEMPTPDLLTEKEKAILEKWAKSRDSHVFFNVKFSRGGIYQLGNDQYQYQRGKEEAEWDDFFKKLEKLEFVVKNEETTFDKRKNTAGTNIRYRLTTAAYKYIDNQQ